jgi:hypothetical protein
VTASSLSDDLSEFTRTIITREDAAKWRRTLPKANIKDAPKARNNGLPPWLPGAQRQSLNGLK